MRRVLTEDEDMDMAVKDAAAHKGEAGPDMDAIAGDMDGEEYDIDAEEEQEISFNASALIRALEHAMQDFMDMDDADSELHEFAEMIMKTAAEKDGPIDVEDLEAMFEDEAEEEAKETGNGDGDVPMPDMSPEGGGGGEGGEDNGNPY